MFDLAAEQLQNPLLPNLTELIVGLITFGIIFVVIFKIFHLRPARRKLLIEAEAQNPPGDIYIRTPAPEPIVPS